MRNTYHRLFITILLSSLFFWAEAAPINFTPIIENYTVNDYNAAPQNWSIAQDKNGVMYFGNNNGLLEFDGNTWILHELPNKESIRSVFVKDDRIYIGSYEEFGYFCNTPPEQNFEYHSLKEKVEDFVFMNDEIWNILCIGDEIIFQSFSSIFFYDGETVEGIRYENNPLNIIKVGDTCYSQIVNGDLCRLSNHQMIKFIGREELNSDVISCLPYDNGLLLLTYNRGGYIYHNNGTIEKWNTDCDASFHKNPINHAIVTDDGHYIVGTISNGIYALDKNGHRLWEFNTDNNLNNNTILKLFTDDNNNIWAGLDDGIAFIHNNSFLSYYKPPFQQIGTIFDILIEGDDTYIASNQGLYYYPGNNKPELVDNLTAQTWFIGKFSNQILCGHNEGTYEISHSKANQISDRTGGLSIVEVDLQGQSYLLEGTYTNILLYSKNKENKYEFAGCLPEFSQMICRIEQDSQGNIWAQHLQNGFFRLRINGEKRQIETVKKYDNLGDVKEGRFPLFKVNGRIVFTNGTCFYTYDDINDAIIPYEAMNKSLASLHDIMCVYELESNQYWFIGKQAAYLVGCSMNNFSLELTIPYRLFDATRPTNSKGIFYDKASKNSYICLNKAIVRVNHEHMNNDGRKGRSLSVMGLRVKDNKSEKYKVLAANNDINIEPNFNTVNFILRYPVYENFGYNVRYKLNGYSNQWISDKQSMEYEFANLPYGSYVFEAEVYTSDMILARTELPFKILRPWYFSYLAITGYILVGIGLLLLSFYLVYIYVKRKKDRVIEQQRIAHQAEIERQEKRIIELDKEQLEYDLRLKSKELSSAMMTNIAHQKFLNSLKEEILQQKLSGHFSNRNYDRLLSMLDNNIVSDETNWNVFQANFDRIHENFFRNLTQKYPDLTHVDLRFCALIRLNMQNKDIAKLLNISTRGVDAARYRLRKKFNLSPEDSLTYFILNFN